MEPRKLTKEDIDKVRDIEGFPIGTDEDIIALSDAPYYTACPNPFIEEFIKENGTPYDEATDDYHREPFAADVSEGKNDPIYMAHSYHTKVPHKAIMQYILHYTKPGDIVFDGFCGTGMTGVAAKMCEQSEFEQLAFSFGNHASKNTWGARNAIICDLSPAAIFIAHHYNHVVNSSDFEAESRRILSECENELGWMYETDHDISLDAKLPAGKGRINYLVWSDVYICPTCGKEFVFWDVAVDAEHGKVNSSFCCPACNTMLAKKDCEPAKMLEFDAIHNKARSVAKQVPVRINYTYMGKRFEKKPDKFDFELLEKIEQTPSKYWYPTNQMCVGTESWRNEKIGITNVDQFYYRRNLLALAAFAAKARNTSAFILVQSVSMVNTKLYRYRWAGGFAGAGGGPLAGTLYMPSIVKDINILKSLSEYITKITKAKRLLDNQVGSCILSTQSSAHLCNIPDNSCDYIFTDPPFGDNLNYSELSFLWESWLKIVTNQKDEAIVNKAQNKGLLEYQTLMTECLKEFFRILKPNRWITVEFHNSKNAVWNAIQESILRAGFIVADVRTLDKKQGSFKQVNNSSSVKQDLVISAYKPKESFTRDFANKAGTEETAWAFVRQHLDKLPIVVDADGDGKIDILAERQAYLLFDRMVAYHIMQGIPVPLDATDFYRGLDEKFLKRDNMYFLPDQVNEYDTARIKTDVENIQFSLFVTNEKTAISWLYQQLDEKMDGPQTYAEIQPKFMQEVKSVDRYEAMPELSVILEENFLQDENGRWYIPDVTKEGDVAKLREKKLWKEFEGYLNSKGKLKSFRSEAVRVGFSRLWKDKNYQAIVAIAERLPESTIQEDPNLLMYYDISLGRV